MDSGLRLALILISGVLGSTGPEIARIEVSPLSVRLEGSDAAAQLLVTGIDHTGRAVDLTKSVTIETANKAVARPEIEGVVRATGDGQTILTIKAGGKVATVPLTVVDFANSRLIQFDTEIVPILTKFGCNAGACHGKSSGQNGFRLSLLGFDPKSDYDALAREGRGRRVLPGAPASSLFVKKPTAQVPHGGGKRFAANSVEARTIMRWIGQGLPRDAGDKATLVALEVEPAQRLIPRKQQQQLRVSAKYSDGRTIDVTRLAQFQSNAADVAIVTETGRVETLDGVGEAAVMARFGGMVGVSRVTVPLSSERPTWTDPASKNPIDVLVFRKLRELGVEPSGPCTDSEFARRSSLDLCGILPEAIAVESFVTSTLPDKRSRWVEQLVDRPEYADLFALKWSAILKNKRGLGLISRPGSFAFHAWIRQSIAENKPYDRFVAEIVAARGDSAINPPLVWYRQVNTLESRVDDTAQLFLGTRIQCARCHHHPFERWSQDDYYGFASFFTRIGTKGNDPTNPRLYLLPSGLAMNPINGKSLPPKPLGGAEFAGLSPYEDPRDKLAEWLRDRDNPYFAKALVNRYWKHFMGRGLVEPEDDMRVSNPPSNPELLDMLAKFFIASNYNMKLLVRLIATSQTYDRSSLPNGTNERDRRNFARFYARRLPAEVLLDAINKVAATREPFAGLPESFKATQLPDDGFDSEFLTIFGRPKRESVCECERSSEANLSQTLHLLNSPELQGKVASAGSRAAKLASNPRATAVKINELYRIALGRIATAEEMEICLTHLEKSRQDKKRQQGYEDLVWAIMNTKEFLFNQ